MLRLLKNSLVFLSIANLFHSLHNRIGKYMQKGFRIHTKMNEAV